MIGRIHSFESMGAVDGPGIRFVIFLQGCPMRCAYCHNPDSWDFSKGKEVSTDDCINEITKYKSYFGTTGGVTVSGGEPLCQIDFLIELFKKLQALGINTCLDSSGIIFDKTNKELLKKFNMLMKYTNLVLLDIKHIDNEKHVKLTTQSNKNVLNFASYLSQKNIKMWIRYVLVPDINTDIETLSKTKKFINTLNGVEKVEILPYHTLGVYKYNQLGINYRLADTEPPSEEQIKLANSILQITKEK